MENKWPGAGEMNVSADEAEAALHSVSELTASAGWGLSWRAAAVVGMAFAPVITAAVWGYFWWFFAGLALWAVLVLVLRRRLFNPHVRVRPWQHLDKQTVNVNWGTAFWPMWIPLTMLVPAQPMWIGPVVGILAGIYTYWVMQKLGERT